MSKRQIAAVGLAGGKRDVPELRNMSRGVFIMLIIAATIPGGCVVERPTSVDPDKSYSLVFPATRQPKPIILNSRVERYAKNMGLWKSKERNGEWEFEIRAPRAWVDEVKTGFVSTSFTNVFRWPSSSWWAPTAEAFDAFEMPYSSYPAAHLYVEKNPKDENRIHVFIQRH